MKRKIVYVENATALSTQLFECSQHVQIICPLLSLWPQSLHCHFLSTTSTSIGKPDKPSDCVELTEKYTQSTLSCRNSHSTSTIKVNLLVEYLKFS